MLLQPVTLASNQANEALELQATTVPDPGGERNKAAAERGHLANVTINDAPEDDDF